MFLNTKLQRILSSADHTIFKSFRKSGDMSVRKGHLQELILDAPNLWAHRQHCTKNSHDSVMKITAWAQEHFQKSLSVSTVCHAIRLKFYHAKRKMVRGVYLCL